MLSRFLRRKPTGKRPLGRPRRRWEDNVRMHFEEIGINARNWVDSAQDRDYWRALVNAALNFRVPQATELDNIPFIMLLGCNRKHFIGKKETLVGKLLVSVDVYC